MFSALLPQAITVVQHCLKVQPGDDVLLVSDESLDEDMITSFRAAVAQAGARGHFITYEPFHRYSPQEHCRFAGASLCADQLKLPAILLGAMEGADAILLLNSDLEITFVPTFKELARRKRIVSLAYLSLESALRMLPSSAEEVEEVRRGVEEGEKAMAGAVRARITSPQGTDITMSLGQYPAMGHYGVVGYGWLPLLAAGQVLRVPDDASANGRFVIDRTVSAHEYKVVEEPIAFLVANGNLVRIEGELEAQRLSRWLEDLKDPGMYHVTELAFGTNPRCRFSGVAPPTEDTHTRGAVSLALGCDVHFQGSVKAYAHCDMTMREATLELDGKAIIRDGRLLI